MGFLSDLASNPVGALSGATAARRQLSRGTAAATQALEEGFQEARGFQDPFFQAGTGALQQLVNFDPSRIARDPGFKFQLQQGLGALETGAAARGGLLSGANLAAQQQFGQGLASDFAQQQFGRLSQLANLGFGAGANLANLRTGQAAGTSAAQLGAGQGAASIVGNLQAPFMQELLKSGVSALAGGGGAGGGGG